MIDPRDVPVTEAEIEVFEAWFDDRVDEFLRRPFGPGRRRPPDEKNRRYLRFLSAWWNLNKVPGLRDDGEL